jgi:hypothetical protein
MNLQSFSSIYFHSHKQNIDNGDDIEILYKNKFTNTRIFQDLIELEETENIIHPTDSKKEQTDKSTYNSTDKPIDKSVDKLIIDENTILGNKLKHQKQDKNIFKVSKTKENLTINCHICKKTFKRNMHLINHIKTHEKLPIKVNEGDRVFICPVDNCGKIYKSKENLVIHNKNIHLKIKPYKCKYCKSHFSHRNGKLYHERRFHENNLNSLDSLNDLNINVNDNFNDDNDNNSVSTSSPVAN